MTLPRIIPITPITPITPINLITPITMTSDTIRHRLLGLTALASDYCVALENASETTKEEFVALMLDYLPRIYWEFSDIDAGGLSADYGYFSSYVDEDYYESVRRHVEALLGPDDVFLETFEEDMKYSDTPVASSVAECLADIFQPLFNFISIVKESEGEQITEAFMECKENFVAYWSQTLCNVMRALNNIRYNTNQT